MELYNKEKKKAEVSMRKKGWKDNEDSSLEKFMEIQKANKRVRKDMDALISVSRMFKYDMKVMVGKAVYMFKIFEDWIKRDNAASYISEKARDDDGRVVIQAVGIETTDPVLAFPCMMPTFMLYKESGKGKVYQYVWVLKFPVCHKMESSCHLLEKAIAYLCPGAKPIYKTKGIMVPGIKDVRTLKEKTELLYNMETKYSLSEIWEEVGKRFPVRGRALKVYINNDMLYREGLSTTKQFIAIRRLNSLRRMIREKKDLKDLEWKQMKKVLYWFWCFAMDVGYEDDEIVFLIDQTFRRQGIIMPQAYIKETKADSTYKIKNETLNDVFGLQSDKYFHVPKKKMPKEEYVKQMDDKKTAMTKAVTSLFYKGLTVAQIAEELHISKRTVISRKNDAKKFGWIPFRGKFFEKSLCWTA